MKMRARTCYSFYGFFLLTMTVFFSCSENELQTKSASVQFKVFDKTSLQARVSHNRPPVAVKVSIKISDDTEIVYSHILNLIEMNGEYLSESVQLTIGDYQLTEFLVLDDSSKTIYAAPI